MNHAGNLLWHIINSVFIEDFDTSRCEIMKRRCKMAYLDFQVLETVLIDSNLKKNLICFPRIHDVILYCLSFGSRAFRTHLEFIAYQYS